MFGFEELVLWNRESVDTLELLVSFLASTNQFVALISNVCRGGVVCVCQISLSSIKSECIYTPAVSGRVHVKFNFDKHCKL